MSCTLTIGGKLRICNYLLLFDAINEGDRFGMSVRHLTLYCYGFSATLKQCKSCQRVLCVATTENMTLESVFHIDLSKYPASLSRWTSSCVSRVRLPSNLYAIYALFLRYGDLLAENCKNFLSHSHLTPSLGMNPFEFLAQLFTFKTRFHGLSPVKIS